MLDDHIEAEKEEFREQVLKRFLGSINSVDPDNAYTVISGQENEFAFYPTLEVAAEVAKSSQVSERALSKSTYIVDATPNEMRVFTAYEGIKKRSPHLDELATLLLKPGLALGLAEANMHAAMEAHVEQKELDSGMNLAIILLVLLAALLFIFFR